MERIRFFMACKFFTQKSFFSLFFFGGSLVHFSCISRQSTPVPTGFSRKVTKEKSPSKRYLQLLERSSSEPLKESDTTEAFLYANVFLSEQQPEAAKQLYKGIFENSPNLTVGLKYARLLSSTGEVNKALDIIRKLALFHPKSDEPPVALAFLLRLNGSNDEAEETLQRAYKLHPKSIEVTARYIETLLEAGKAVQAKSLLRKALKDLPNASYLYLKLARMELEAKNNAQAKALLNQLLRFDPDNTEAWTLAGFIAMEEKDQIAAERYFREAYEKQPENDLLARYFVNQLLRQEKYSEARRLLLRLEVSATPEQEFDPELEFQLAYSLFQLAEFEEAKLRFLKLSEKASDKGRMYFFAGQCDESAKKLETALETYQKVESVSEFFDEARQRVVLIHLDLGKFENARTFLSEFSIKNSETETNFRFMAQAHARLKEYSKSAKIILLGLRKFEKSEDLKYLEAVYKEYTVSKAESLKALEAFIILHPKHAQALNHLGYSLADTGNRMVYAKDLLTRAVQIEPKNGFYLDSLGWAYAKIGNTAEAEKHLLRALQLEPQEPIILEHLGEVKLLNLEYALALRYFERAQDLFEKQPNWKVQNDSEWKVSSAHVTKRVQELRSFALGQEWKLNKELSQ
jgi:Flp pilus assembly protein TadD